MSHALVRHRVADFNIWKAAYDAHASARAAAGLTEIHLLRNADNPNEIILFYSVADADLARAFAASGDLRSAMQAAGVTDLPDIYFLN